MLPSVAGDSKRGSGRLPESDQGRDSSKRIYQEGTMKATRSSKQAARSDELVDLPVPQAKANEAV